MRPVVVVQQYPLQALAMRRPGGRPAFLLLFSARQVFGAGTPEAGGLGATLARALARVGAPALEWSGDFGHGRRHAEGIGDALRLLRGLEARLRMLFATAFQSEAAGRFLAAVAGARSAHAGAPCFACVIDHPGGSATARAFLPPRMSGEAVLGFGFFEPGRPIHIEALPRSAAGEVKDPYVFLVTGRV